MRPKNSFTFLRRLLLFTCVFCVCNFQAKAQGICVHEDLVVVNVAGRVVAQLGRGETPLHDIAVKLLQDRSKGRVIAQMVTQTDGVFSFGKKRKSGKYILEVSYKPYLATYSSRIYIIGTRQRGPGKEIVVTLGADFTKPCGGSYAELRSRALPSAARANKALQLTAR